MQSGQTPHQFTPTAEKIHLETASGIWQNSCLVFDINSNLMAQQCCLTLMPMIRLIDDLINLFIFNRCKGDTWDNFLDTPKHAVELHIFFLSNPQLKHPKAFVVVKLKKW